MKNPYIKITGKDNGLADVEGICDTDDVILFCRTAMQTFSETIETPHKHKMIQECFVSILRATCDHKEALQALDDAKLLLIQNHKALGPRTC